MSPTSDLIWQSASWPQLRADAPEVAPALMEARLAWHRLQVKAEVVGLPDAEPLWRDVWVQDVMATSAIEGETLDLASVRSSVMRQLGLPAPEGSPAPSERVDGLVALTQDATVDPQRPVTHERLHRWHQALFPLSTLSGLAGPGRGPSLTVGRYRDHADAMQIVSGFPGREVVHYTAPPSSRVPTEMQTLLDWFEATTPGRTAPAGPRDPVDPPVPAIDGIARAALVHLWFETIHPYEDGNGRIGRALMDLAMAQELGLSVRLCSLSGEILRQRRDYYAALQQAQHGGTDVSAWVIWFARLCIAACDTSARRIDLALEKSRFWHTHAAWVLNARQRKVIQRLLDDGDGGFLGGLNAAKYMKMTGASKATATRDLSDLVSGGLLRTRGLGKALRYELTVPGWGGAIVSP